MPLAQDTINAMDKINRNDRMILLMVGGLKIKKDKR